MSSKKGSLFSFLFPFAGAATLCAADMIIKNKIEADSGLNKGGEPVKKGIFLISKQHNRGALLNLGQKYPAEVRGMSIFATALTFIMLAFTGCKKGRFLEKTGLALVLGGAASNTYDRVKRQYVVDYVSLDVKPKKIRNIVFNLSDVGVFLGSILVLISNLTAKDRAL